MSQQHSDNANYANNVINGAHQHSRKFKPSVHAYVYIYNPGNWLGVKTKSGGK